jgi:hypothetical protein
MGEAIESGDPTRMPGGTPQGLPYTWVLLGEPERALDVLEKMVFSMPFRVQYDIWDPVMAPIWGMSRFQQVILPRVRLEGAVPRFAPAPDDR